MPVEVSTSISPLRGTSPREGITPTAWRGLPPREGLFLHKPALSPRQNAHGLCASRRVTGTPARNDASTVVAILLYKVFNKAAPSKGGPRLATLVIRRPSDAADEGDVTVGHSKAPAATGPPSWLDGGFFSFGDAAPAVDRV